METTRRVLVLTDLVDSTHITAELGDVRAAELWSAHDDSIRGLIAAHRGIEIDKSDGFLVVFDSLPDAIAFQGAYHAALVSPLRARIGVHAGEVIFRRPSADQIARGAKPIEVDGIAKALAARLMALANGGQTLATSEVAALSPGARSLGHYRLKGIDDPVEVWALSGDRPADGDKAHRVVLTAGSWVAVERLAHGLGAETDRLVGRSHELARLDALLRSGARVFTLVGPGGVGKTRLARHWAQEQLAEFKGGTFFVDLAPVSDEAGLFRAVARALDVQLASDPAAQLGRALGARGRLLVVLDNFEQIAALSPHVGTWVAAAPELTVLTTSRQRLGLRGEHLVDVDPLPLPPPPEAASVALFVERARQLVPDFALDEHTLPAVIEIVRRLDGLPLALELAAARMRTLGVLQLLDRLQKSLGVLKEDARPDRQRTLLAAIDWSWQLLTPEEQVVLQEASVFRGPFELEAAEAVLTAEDAALDLVQELVDKSLVRAEDAGAGRRRYRLLQSIRAVAEEKLAASEHAKLVRDRHARWVFALAVAPTTDPLRLSESLPNLRAAILHAASDAALARVGMPLVHRVSLWTAAEARELIAIARPFLDGAELGRLLLFEARVAYQTNEPARAAELDARAHEVFTSVGDARGAAEALADRATCLWYAGDPQSARTAEEAVAAADRTGDEHTRIYARARRSTIWSHDGRVEEAEAGYRERVSFAERADADDLPVALVNFGVILALQGRYREAADAIERSVALSEQAGRKNQLAGSLANLGSLLLQLDPPRAVVVLESALAHARSQGSHRVVQLVLPDLACAYVLCLRMEDFVRTATAEPTPNRRHEASADLVGAVRDAYVGNASRARQRLDDAVRDLRALKEPDPNWMLQRALGAAFVALAEARAGTRTLDEAVAVARAEAETTSVGYRAIDGEIDRTRAMISARGSET